MNLKNPQHIAVIMDGNGRWAAQRFLPRSKGHYQGLQAARSIIKLCLEYNIEILSLFAFSTENWQRSKFEIKILMDLLHKSLHEELDQLHSNKVVFNVIGDLNDLPLRLQDTIKDAMALTKNNSGLKLNLAISYGGKWDLVQAVKKILLDFTHKCFNIIDLNEHALAKYLSLASLPDPDLMIRTGGEKRLSNFFLWQSAYTELFFTDVLWPDFNEKEFKAALDFYTARTRKFGKTLEKSNYIET